LLFDPDAAGGQATLRGGELLIAEGFQVRVVILPDGLDADELLIRDGKEKLDECLNASITFLDYCLAQSMSRHTPKTPEGKLAVVKDILPLVQKVRDPLLQDEYLTRLADAVDVDRMVLGKELKATKTRPERETAEPGAAPKSALCSLEEEILLLALLYPSKAVGDALESFPWQQERCSKAWSALGTSVSDGTLHLADILPGLSADLQDWLTPLAMEQREYRDPAEMLKQFMEAWHRQEESLELSRLRPEIDSMLEGRTPMDSQKLEIFKDLSRRLKGSAKEMQREAMIHGRNASS